MRAPKHRCERTMMYVRSIAIERALPEVLPALATVVDGVNDELGANAAAEPTRAASRATTFMVDGLVATRNERGNCERVEAARRR